MSIKNPHLIVIAGPNGAGCAWGDIMCMRKLSDGVIVQVLKIFSTFINHYQTSGVFRQFIACGAAFDSFGWHRTA